MQPNSCIAKVLSVLRSCKTCITTMLSHRKTTAAQLSVLARLLLSTATAAAAACLEFSGLLAWTQSLHQEYRMECSDDKEQIHCYNCRIGAMQHNKSSLQWLNQVATWQQQCMNRHCSMGANNKCICWTHKWQLGFNQIDHSIEVS